MKELTREELARGRELLKAAFVGPWRYKQFEIECRRCDSYEQGLTDTECTNPECNGEEVPCTFVEAPEAYPNDPDYPQVVATIDVPGLSCIAEQNGEAICWLRNHGEALISAREQLDKFAEALTWLSTDMGHTELCVGLTHDGAYGAVQRVLDYAKSLGWTGARHA